MKSFFDKLFTKDGLKRILFSFVWLALLIFVIDRELTIMLILFSKLSQSEVLLQAEGETK